MGDEIVYSAQEVADILKIKKNTVYNMIKRGDLVAYRVGNKVRVSDVELNNYKKRIVTSVGSGQRVSAEIKNSSMHECSVPTLFDEPAQYGNVGVTKGSGDAYPNRMVICGQESALDSLANHIQNLSNGTVTALRSYVGSFNGLSMLYQGQVSIASAHLWDGESNTYNVSYVKPMLPGVPAVIIHLFNRMQGYYVNNGNPKNIQTWEDLGRKDITMVNREKGSGTRVLLDEKLRIVGVNPSQIAGYKRECFSHLAVAGVVARGGADVGIGTFSSAKIVQGIDFIPLQQESYDLVIKKEDMNDPAFRLVLDIIRSQEYQMELEGMDMYDLSNIGEIVAET